MGNEGATALARALLPITLFGQEGEAALFRACCLGRNSDLHKLGTYFAEPPDSRNADRESSQTLITEYRTERTPSASSHAVSEQNEIVQPALTSLNMTDNNIGPPGLTEIALALRENKVLKTLMLSDNRCEDRGATALANSLKHNSSIESMFFYDNTIQLEATSAVTEILSASAYLKHTDMVFEVGRDVAKRKEQIARARTRPTPIQEDTDILELPRHADADPPQLTKGVRGDAIRRVAEIPPPDSPLQLASPVRNDFAFLDEDDVRGELGVRGMSGKTLQAKPAS